MQAERAAADRRRRLRRVMAPFRAAARSLTTLAYKFGIKTAPAALPSKFDPRDPDGKRLVTALRPQLPGDQRCYAFATAAAMEAWLCRRANSSVDVPYLSLAELDTGNDSPVLTAERADKGIHEAGNSAHLWKLRHSILDDDMNENISAMQRALVNGSPLVTSIPVYASFVGFTDATESISYAPHQGEELLDAHALCIIGYDAPNRGWIVKNSDPAWGHNGYGMVRAAHPALQVEKLVVSVDSVTLQ